jgi:hypothetical protein
VGRRHLPCCRSPPRSGVVAPGVLPPRRLLSPQAQLHIVQRHLPHSHGCAWIHGGRQARLWPADGCGWFHRGRWAQASGFSLTAARGFALAALVADGGAGGPPWEVLQLIRSEPRRRPLSLRSSLLQLPSTRTSQELMPLVVRGSSYSYVPVRSTCSWSGMCPASASSTPGSCGEAAPWGAPPLRAEAPVPGRRVAADALPSGSFSSASTTSGSSAFGATPSPSGSPSSWPGGGGNPFPLPIGHPARRL